MLQHECTNNLILWYILFPCVINCFKYHKNLKKAWKFHLSQNKFIKVRENYIRVLQPSWSCMESFILVLHPHGNHTSQTVHHIHGYIYQALHSKLEHFVTIPWLHRYI
jgi:hypothetical protein